MLPVLVVLFVVVPLAELWIVVQVGQAIGVVDTAVLLLLDAAVGAWLVRREARRAWSAVRTAMSSGRLPAHEAGDAVVVAVGGAFLLAPGFLTDLVGLVCVLPATRPWARRVLWRAVLGRMLLGRRAGSAKGGAPRAPDSSGPSGRVVDGSVVPPRPPRGRTR